MKAEKRINITDGGYAKTYGIYIDIGEVICKTMDQFEKDQKELDAKTETILDAVRAIISDPSENF